MKAILNHSVTIVIVLFAVFFAMVVTPGLSESLGVPSEKFSFILGGILGVVAIGCLIAAKAMNKKKA